MTPEDQKRLLALLEQLAKNPEAMFRITVAPEVEVAPAVETVVPAPEVAVAETPQVTPEPQAAWANAEVMATANFDLVQQLRDAKALNASYWKDAVALQGSLDEQKQALLTLSEQKAELETKCEKLRQAEAHRAAELDDANGRIASLERMGASMETQLDDIRQARELQTPRRHWLQSAFKLGALPLILVCIVILAYTAYTDYATFSLMRAGMARVIVGATLGLLIDVLGMSNHQPETLDGIEQGWAWSRRLGLMAAGAVCLGMQP